MSVVPAMLAERLGLPQLTFAGKVDVDGGTVTHPAATSDDGYDDGRGARCPPSVSVVEKINEPRYPSFKGIMAAKKKPVETLSLADLGVDAGRGRPGRRLDRGRGRSPRARRAGAGKIVKDEGDGGAKLAEFLVAKKFI